MHKLLSTTLFAAFTLAAASAAYAQAAIPTTTVPGGPDLPQPAPSTYSCSDELGYLRRVHTAELAGVQDPSRVWVTPICVGDNMFRTEGNAGALRGAIANSKVLSAALDAKTFRPEDVVGVRMIDARTVTLYVNPLR